MSEDNFTADQYIKSLERTNRIVEPAIRQAVWALGIKEGRALDIPCGIGNHSIWLAECYPNLSVEGADFAPEHIEYAKALASSRALSNRVSFMTADMNKLEYQADSFDFIWCCDGLWPGPAEMGCVAEQPYTVLESFKQIVKPGGTIAVLFWSSQKLLPGYPLVEAGLNACPAANIPMTEDKSPELHFMSTPSWLRKIGLNDVRSRTFSVDINSPLDEETRKALHRVFEMFWGGAAEEAPARIWAKYKSITDPESDDYILASPDYAAFLTYTMFTGVVPL